MQVETIFNREIKDILKGYIDLLVVDKNDKTNMNQVVFIDSTNVLDLKIKGDYLYFVDDWGGLKVVDISNPVLASVLSKVDGEFYKLALENNYLYTIGITGLSSFDLTSPAAPVYKATVNILNTNQNTTFQAL